MFEYLVLKFRDVYLQKLYAMWFSVLVFVQFLLHTQSRLHSSLLLR